MANVKDICAGIVAENSGISKQEAREIIDMTVAEKERVAAVSSLGNADAKLARWGMDKAKEAQIAAALQRKHVALNVLIREKLSSHIEKFAAETGGNYVEAVRSILDGSFKKAGNAGKSVHSRYTAISQGWHNGLELELSRIPGAFDLLKKDANFLRDVVAHMMGDAVGDSKARAVGALFARYAEGARKRLNDAGAFIGRLEGWVPQHHDAARIGRAGMEKWLDEIMPRLDLERSFGDVTEEEARVILEKVYGNLVIGKDNLLSAAATGQFMGPRNLAKSMGAHRVLHFKSAGDWLDYHALFGPKGANALTAIFGHLDVAARKLALMEALGPNPETMLNSLLQEAKLQVKYNPNLDQKTIDKQWNRLNHDLQKRHGGIGHAFAEVMGETLMAENPSLAKIGTTLRNWQVLSKLGKVIFSSIPDLITYAAAYRYRGKNLLSGYRDAMQALFTRFTKGEAEEIVRRIGVLSDGMLYDVVSRFAAEDMGTGMMTNWINRFFKLNGMEWWTSRLKSGYALSLSNDLAEMAGKSFDQLNDGLRQSLERMGIDARKWEAVASMAAEQADGRAYITPDMAKALPDEAVDRLVAEDMERLVKKYQQDVAGRLEAKQEKLLAEGVDGEKLAKRLDTARRRYAQTALNHADEYAEAAERARERGRRNLETELRAWFLEETRFAHIEPDARNRAFVTQGTKRGTAVGEALRFFFQFKSFPLAFGNRILRGGRVRVKDIPGSIHFITTSLILGYVAMAAKDLLKGREPRDPFDRETWMAALLQSGGAGIYGDLLMGEYNRFGGGAISTLGGPMVGTIDDLARMWGKTRSGEDISANAFNFAKNNTPFLNLWFARPAADYLLLYDIQEAVRPGSLKRMEKRLKRENNQEYLFPPSKYRLGG